MKNYGYVAMIHTIEVNKYKQVIERLKQYRYPNYNEVTWTAQKSDCNQILLRSMEDRRHLRYIWGLHETDPTDMTNLMIIPGVGRKKALLLYNHEIRTLTDISENKIAELLVIPGVGNKFARQLKRSAKQCLKDRGEQKSTPLYYSDGSYRSNKQRGQTREW